MGGKSDVNHISATQSCEWRTNVHLSPSLIIVWALGDKGIVPAKSEHLQNKTKGRRIPDFQQNTAQIHLYAPC
jgi:hypothetical protein